MKGLLAAGLGLLALGQAGPAQDPYADKPYWYQPGHPLEPAQAAALKTAEGFGAERILTVPREMGSWTALAVDPKGRLIASAQHLPGLFRVTPPAEAGAATKVERLKGAAEKVGWSHGLLWAFDSLYVMVSEKSPARGGLHRLRDTDGDGELDSDELVFPLSGAGEHGPHNIVVSPDGRTLTLMAGNGVAPPAGVVRRRTVRTDGPDHVMPPGFDTTEHSVQGWVCRFDPDGGNRELICSGLRNSFDLAYNREGELFTFDSDMEWDLGAPWYRPTRICHLVSGGEYGWRKGSGIWPDYYPDSVPAVLNVGPASPTGLTFGTGARFPARYQRALYACDWTFGTIHAVHLRPRGAGYEAVMEEFLGGRGMPVTEAVIGTDGAMYVVVGGRELVSAVYRIRYTGSEPVEPAGPLDTPEAREARTLRRMLEDFHGRRDEKAVDAAWPHLGSPDPILRHAARLAVEHQPVSSWKERALGEPDVDRKAFALLALARQAEPREQPAVLRALADLPWAGSDDRRLAVLRATQLAFARGASHARPLAPEVVARLDKAFPDPDGRMNRELARLLGYLKAPDVVGRFLAAMEADAGHPETLGKSYFARNDKYGKAVADMLKAAPMVQRMHLAQMLIWVEEGWTPEFRKRYFQLIAEAAAHSKGGHGYREFWERTRKHALEAVPAGLRDAMEAIQAGGPPAVDPATLPRAKGPGRAWTVEAVIAEIGGGLKGRSFENGRTMFAAASCVVCHRLGSEGGTVGPRLTGLSGRFTLRDMVEAVVEPSKAVSDQYRAVQIRKTNGDVVAGRVAWQEGGSYHLMPDMMRPGATVTVRAGEIDAVKPLETSPMPPRLIDALSRDEALDLFAYLVAEGDPEHAAFRD